jgi:SAM-dependent methyltransferase
MGRIDNCDFSATTVWAEHESAYKYAAGKPAGRSYFCEGSDLKEVRDGSYDAVLSSHNLEHFANPVKALKEWQRVLRPGGVLVLVLPHYEDTFDHRRTPTSVEHMLNDYANEMGEDDITHLPEILEKHDLNRDKAAGTSEEFRRRSLDNLGTRCLHHHVFDENNATELLEAVGFDVLTVDRAKPYHLCLLGRY